MSDVPTVQERAAEVIAITPHDADWEDESPMLIADALAAAGLLADPATPALTDEQQAVIDAAKAWETWRLDVFYVRWPAEDTLIAAVDRLAATGGTCPEGEPA